MEPTMSLITSPLEAHLFRFEVGRGVDGLITTCIYLPLNLASSDFDAREPGYQSKFVLYVARKLVDDQGACEEAMKWVGTLDRTVETFMANLASRTVCELAALEQIRNPDAVMFFLAHAMKEHLEPPPELYALSWIWNSHQLRSALSEYLRESKDIRR